MKLNTTPSPWYFKETDENTIEILRKYDSEVSPATHDGYGSCFGIHIAKLKHQNENSCVSKKTALANARLISAAPEMLEILINCVGLNETLDSDIIPLIEKVTDMKIEEVLEEK